MKKLFSEKLREFKLNIVQSFKNSPVEIIISILFFALFVVCQYVKLPSKHIGNCVSGYQIANNGSFIYHNQNWSGRFCGPTDSQEHTLELDYMATPYNPQITQINNKYYYYNQIGNLPHLFSVNNYVSVNCSSSRTITFEMNYINQ